MNIFLVYTRYIYHVYTRYIYICHLHGRGGDGWSVLNSAAAGECAGVIRKFRTNKRDQDKTTLELHAFYLLKTSSLKKIERKFASKTWGLPNQPSNSRPEGPRLYLEEAAGRDRRQGPPRARLWRYRFVRTETPTH